MLLTPFLSATILLRRVSWLEFVALLAIACAFAIKDLLIVIARQRTVWKQEHAETKTAKSVIVIEIVLLGVCAVALSVGAGWRLLLPFVIGGGAFTVLGVVVNVRNRQRSEWFQVASVVALTSTSLIACISVEGRIAEWYWLLWLLSALQAAAGIFVVHARLNARIASSKGGVPDGESRRAAFLAQLSLIIAAVSFAALRRFWIAAALLIAAACYLMELKRQTDKRSLQMPLTRVGKQALALSIVYGVLVIIDLW